YRAHRSSHWLSVTSGEMVTGSVIMPESLRFTLSTSEAWSVLDSLLWITPKPPLRTIAIYSGDSVTVSMAAEMMVTLMLSRLVSWVDTSASAGITSVALGNSKTSS